MTLRSPLSIAQVALAAFFFACAPAAAQWQVQENAVPVGRGGQTQGFKSVPLPSGAILIGQTGAPLAFIPSGDVTINTLGVTAIGTNKVLNGMLRQSAALSLVGRSANTTGNVGDIAAVSGSSCAYRENGGTIGCGTLATAAYAASSVTNAKLAQMANGTVKGRTTAGTGDPEDLSAAQTRSLLSLVVGTNVQAWDADLDCVAAISTSGIITRTGAGTCAVRQVVAPAAGITITNPAGTAGDITLALANDLAALEALSGTGIARRTGPDAWSVGSLILNSELASMANGTTKCRTTAGAGDPEDCTASQAKGVLALVKGDVGLGNVDNTSDVTKWAATKTLTNTTYNCASTGNVCNVRIGSDVSGLGTGVAAWLAAPTSANLAAALPDETGSGSAVFGTGPTISALNTTGVQDNQGTLKLSSFVTATQITANQNNYTASDGTNSCATKTALRLSSDAARSITGLSCSQAEGDIRVIHNVDVQNILLTNQDAASTTTNRFSLGADLTLLPNYSVTLRYDGVSARWRAISTPGAGGGGGGGVTSVSVAAGEGVALTGTCTITTTGTCTVARADSVRQNEFLSWIYASKMFGDVRKGINLWATGFKASTDSSRGINAGLSSNYDTTNSSASGYVNPTSSTPSPQGSTRASAVGLGGGLTQFDRSYSLTNGAIVSQIGIDSVNAATIKIKIALRNSATNYTIVVDQTVSHPGGGFVNFTLSSPYTVPGSGTYYVGSYSASDFGVRSGTIPRSYFSGDASGTASGYNEDSSETLPTRVVYASAYNNMTLVTTTPATDAPVTSARILIEFDNTAAPTLNTDLTAEVSCNGGTNFAPASLSAVTSYSQAGRKVVESVDQPCTSGTALTARIKTFNNKNVPLYGASIAGR